jgi:hypothetical protein
MVLARTGSNGKVADDLVFEARPLLLWSTVRSNDKGSLAVAYHHQEEDAETQTALSSALKRTFARQDCQRTKRTRQPQS